MKKLIALFILNILFGLAGCAKVAYEGCVPCKYDDNKGKTEKSIEKMDSHTTK